MYKKSRLSSNINLSLLPDSGKKKRRIKRGGRGKNRRSKIFLSIKELELFQTVLKATFLESKILDPSFSDKNKKKQTNRNCEYTHGGCSPWLESLFKTELEKNLPLTSTLVILLCDSLCCRHPYALG